MSTITLSVPAEVKALLETDAAARKRLEDLAAAIFGNGGSYYRSTNEPHLTPELITSLRRAFAEVDAGDVIDADDAFAELYENVGLTNPPVFNRDNP